MADKILDVVVVGSLNADLVVTGERLPKPGETVAGQSFQTFTGGKGFNQAVAASRAGSKVAMVGKLGQDAFGDLLEEALHQENLPVDTVTRCNNAAISTGVAVITVAANGKNTIVVVPGANFAWLDSDLQNASAVIEQAKILLLQLEIPIEVCQKVAQQAHAAGATVVLTPAPVPLQPLPSTLLTNLDWLVLNETEVRELARIYQVSYAADAADVEVAQALLTLFGQSGPSVIVVTQGEKGVAWVTAGEAINVAAFSVEAVDTTAAGDTFTGALAAAFCRNLPIAEALSFANAAGALAVTKAGATASIPRLPEIEAFLQKSP